MNGLTIYKSSAGSGKTYTLVKEYLKLVLQNPDNYRHILAITFTNKAMAEMKFRIIKALVELAENSNPDLENQLLKEINFKSEYSGQISNLKLSTQAQTVLDKILHDYSNFSICTIDSFFHSVIRAFAKEMHLPLRFDVELDQGNVISTITDNLLQEVGTNKKLTEWLEKLALFKLENDKGWKLEKDIEFIAGELFKEEQIIEIDKQQITIGDFANTLFPITNVFEQTMKKLGNSAIQTIDENGLQVADFAYGKSGVCGYLEKITRKIAADDYKPTARTLTAYANPDKWYSEKSTQKEIIKILVDSRLHKVLADVISFFNEHYEQYVSAKEVLKLIYVFGILSSLNEQLKKYRDEKNLLLVSDITRLLKNFISGNDAPYLFEKVGNKYNHFLIDEFQDTSTLQWNNLLPLVQNSLGSGNFSMLVGDAKQSIYRWRGGNMQLLLKDSKQDLKHFSEIIKEENLNTNYRSKKNIVEFNNEFFHTVAEIIKEQLQLSNNEILDKAYNAQDLKQAIAEKNKEGGYVCVEFIENEISSETEKTESEIKTSNQKLQTQNWKVISLEKLLLTLQQLEKDNYLLKDIAILVRKNTEGNTIANFLFEHGYTKIISPDSLLLSGSPKIIFLTNALLYISNPRNDIAKTQLLYYYNELQNQILNAGNNHALFTDYKKSKNGLSEKFLPERFIAHIPYLSKLPLYELIENLISIFGLNRLPDAYIQRFQDAVLEYTMKNHADIKSFLAWWEEHKNNISVTIPENSDAITIMTIHKAKGLQFPVVIMPFAEWKLEPDSRDILWVSSDKKPFGQFPFLPVTPSSRLKDSYFADSYNNEITQSYIDNLNLLYVAFTRPEERLYLFTTALTLSKEVAAIKTLSHLIHQTMKAEKLKLEIGKPLPTNHQSPITNHQSFPLPEYLSSRWQSKITISQKSQNLLEMFDEQRSDKINWGILVHEILKMIRTQKDIAPSIASLYYQGLVTEREKQELQNKIEELFSISEMQEWFSESWEVKTEKEILLSDGEILRPDRVLIQDKKAVVIDYKTGIPKSEHEKQIQQYAKVLIQLGYNPVEKYLFYVDGKKIQKVL